MDDEQFEAAKARLRAAAHARRAAMSPGERADAAKAACVHFFAAHDLEPKAVVAGYWAIRDEMDCQPILVRLMDSGQPVCLPVVLGPEQPLDLRLWTEGEPLYPSGFGTLAPSELAPLAEPDLILMPLLGFDAQGTRLGYGGGYYDRTLEKLSRRPKLIGLAFAAQEIDYIPRAAHDVPLDAVVTEAGMRHFSVSDAAA